MPNSRTESARIPRPTRKKRFSLLLSHSDRLDTRPRRGSALDLGPRGALTVGSIAFAGAFLIVVALNRLFVLLEQYAQHSYVSDRFQGRTICGLALFRAIAIEITSFHFVSRLAQPAYVLGEFADNEPGCM